MSAKQVSLKSPITIGVVVVLLAGVVVLNVNTFGSGGRIKSDRGYRMQAHPPVPMDAGHLVSCDGGLPDFSAPQTSSAGAIALHRDPFYPKKAQPVAVVSTSRKNSAKVKTSRKKAKTLECTAIMLGGNNPMAIIGGEGHFPGEKIQGMLLVSVDADGVTLRKSNGQTVHLPVGVQEAKNPSFRVITRPKQKDDQGRTRLVDQ